jgi:hypothetical protein
MNIIDKDTFYTDLAEYAGMLECKIHYKDDNGIKQDVYRAFPIGSKVRKEDIVKIVDELRKIKPDVVVDVAIPTPYEAMTLMKDKKVEVATTWKQVVDGVLSTSVVKEGVK